MTNIEIVFTRSKKKFALGSWLIRLWTGKEYSHVARKLERRDWGAGYYQASGNSVNYEHESVFNKKHEIVKIYKLRVSSQLELSIKEACWKEAGKKYALIQNLGIVLCDVLRLLGIRISNPWKEGRNCSELLYVHIFKQMILGANLDEDMVKPHHIEQLILNNFIEKNGVWELKS